MPMSIFPMSIFPTHISYLIRSVFLSVTILALMVSTAIAAPSYRSLTISAVPARASSQDAARARTEAIAAARRQAFSRLVQEMVTGDEREKLPWLEDASIEELVNSFEIRDEKRSSTDYTALSDWHFNTENIRRLFERYGIAYTLVPAPKVVVIPIYRYAGTDLLWEKGNHWYRSWAQTPSSLFTPFILPDGDFSDVITINAQQAIERDCRALRRLADRYSASDFVVAVATLRIQRDDRIRVDMEVRHGRNNQAGQSVLLRLEKEGESSPEHILNQAVWDVLQVIGDDWKRHYAIGVQDGGPIRVRAQFSSIEEWLALYRSVEFFSRHASILSLSSRRAVLDIRPRGDLPSLTRNLVAAGWDMSENDGTWYIKEAEKAPDSHSLGEWNGADLWNTSETGGGTC